jgi:GNAT superfamily N-acetyltransferase
VTAGPEIRPVAYADRVFGALLAECENEGGSFLLRLRDEWRNGATRFDRPGEILLGAFLDGRLIGVGGLTHDPWQPDIGRLRHLYVLREMRGRGVGRLLVSRIVEEARRAFPVLRLRTRAREAARLYESVGFVPTAEPFETHRLGLS